MVAVSIPPGLSVFSLLEPMYMYFRSTWLLVVEYVDMISPSTLRQGGFTTWTIGYG